MKKWLDYLSCAAASSALVWPPAFAQTPPAPLGESASAGYVRDWTIDGTRDRLLSASTRFFSDAREFYIAMPREEASNSELIANQFAYAFHGWPEPEVDLPSGRKLFVGDAPESHREKALVVTDADRATTRAIALFHHSCDGKKRFDRTTKKFTTCPPLPGLTFFVHPGERLDEDVKAEVVQWAKDFAKHNNSEAKSVGAMANGDWIRAFKVNVHTIPG